MRLDEIRKEKLLESAHRLHSGKGLTTPEIKPKAPKWPLTIALVTVVIGLGLAIYAQ